MIYVIDHTWKYEVKYLKYLNCLGICSSSEERYKRRKLFNVLSFSCACSLSMTASALLPLLCLRPAGSKKALTSSRPNWTK